MSGRYEKDNVAKVGGAILCSLLLIGILSGQLFAVFVPACIVAAVFGAVSTTLRSGRG